MNKIKIETMNRDYYAPALIFEKGKFESYIFRKSWGEAQTKYGWTPYGYETSLEFNQKESQFYIWDFQMDLDDPFERKSSTYDVINNEELLALLNKEN